MYGKEKEMHVTSNENYRVRLLDFLWAHDPKQVNHVDELLNKYKGKEEELIQKLHMEFGVRDFSGNYAIDDIYEHQRYAYPLFSWGSSFPGHFLPTDRRRWSSIHGTPSSQVRDYIVSELPKNWKWLCDWEVDLTLPYCDSNGWTYAMDFPVINSLIKRNKGRRVPGITDYVRRRRWIRKRIRYIDCSNRLNQSSLDTEKAAVLEPTAILESENSEASSFNSPGNDLFIDDDDDDDNISDGDDDNAHESYITNAEGKKHRTGGISDIQNSTVHDRGNKAQRKHEARFPNSIPQYFSLTMQSEDVASVWEKVIKSIELLHGKLIKDKLKHNNGWRLEKQKLAQQISMLEKTVASMKEFAEVHWKHFESAYTQPSEESTLRQESRESFKVALLNMLGLVGNKTPSKVRSSNEISNKKCVYQQKRRNSSIELPSYPNLSDAKAQETDNSNSKHENSSHKSKSCGSSPTLNSFELGQKLNRAQAKLISLKRDYFHPRELGYILRFSLMGVFAGCRDYWIEKCMSSFSVSIDREIHKSSGNVTVKCRIEVKGHVTANGNQVKLLGDKGTWIPKSEWEKIYIDTDFKATTTLINETEKNDHSERLWKHCDGNESTKVELRNFKKQIKGGVDIPEAVARKVGKDMLTIILQYLSLKYIPSELAMVFGHPPGKLFLSGEFELSASPIESVMERKIDYITQPICFNSSTVVSGESEHTSGKNETTKDLAMQPIAKLLDLTPPQFNLLVALRHLNIFPPNYDFDSISRMLSYYNDFLYIETEQEGLPHRQKQQLRSIWKRIVELTYIRCLSESAPSNSDGKWPKRSESFSGATSRKINRTSPSIKTVSNNVENPLGLKNEVFSNEVEMFCVEKFFGTLEHLLQKPTSIRLHITRLDISISQQSCIEAMRSMYMRKIFNLDFLNSKSGHASSILNSIIPALFASSTATAGSNVSADNDQKKKRKYTVFNRIKDHNVAVSSAKASPEKFSKERKYPNNIASQRHSNDPPNVHVGGVVRTNYAELMGLGMDSEVRMRVEAGLYLFDSLIQAVRKMSRNLDHMSLNCGGLLKGSGISTLAAGNFEDFELLGPVDTALNIPVRNWGSIDISTKLFSPEKVGVQFELTFPDLDYAVPVDAEAETLNTCQHTAGPGTELKSNNSIHHLHQAASARKFLTITVCDCSSKILLDTKRLVQQCHRAKRGGFVSPRSKSSSHSQHPNNYEKIANSHLPPSDSDFTTKHECLAMQFSSAPGDNVNFENPFGHLNMLSSEYTKMQTFIKSGAYQLRILPILQQFNSLFREMFASAFPHHCGLYDSIYGKILDMLTASTMLFAYHVEIKVLSKQDAEDLIVTLCTPSSNPIEYKDIIKLRSLILDLEDLIKLWLEERYPHYNSPR